MYENLTRPTPISKKPNNVSVRLAPVPVSEKVAYVESVCAALIDDRFGRRMGLFIMDMRELPEYEDEVFGEISDEGLVPTYVVHPHPEMARRVDAAVIRPELAQLRSSAAEARSQQSSPSNLGRGSPKYRWDASRVRRPHVSKGLSAQAQLSLRHTPNSAVDFPGLKTTHLALTHVRASDTDRSLKTYGYLGRRQVAVIGSSPRSGPKHEAPGVIPGSTGNDR